MGNGCARAASSQQQTMGNFHSASEQGRQATASMPEPRLSNKAQLIKQGVWVKSVNEYQVTKQLGKGSFGEVYLATAKGQKVAIKMLKKSALKRQRQGKFGSALDTVKAEIALMKKIRHPNCVGMHEVIDDPSADEVFIVLEFVDGGSSQALGRDGTPIPLKEAAIWSHMRHLVLGLEYLHMNGIVHRDIKPDNLLVSKCAPSARAARLPPASRSRRHGHARRSALTRARALRSAARRAPRAGAMAC